MIGNGTKCVGVFSSQFPLILIYPCFFCSYYHFSVISEPSLAIIKYISCLTNPQEFSADEAIVTAIHLPSFTVIPVCNTRRAVCGERNQQL